MSKKCICAWCGKEYEKTSNRQVCCSKECQENRNRELAAKRQSRYYYRHKIGNTNSRNITDLGSKGTSQTSHSKENFHDEYRSIQSEKKRLGLEYNFISKSLEHKLEETIY
ncbi:hypothetical protein [Methanobrevibacter sp.]|uniref:hypothetical protein n=1 Tax=Methanobrevibacter sp. TaxID=66852 RepID=UPI00388EDEB3